MRPPAPRPRRSRPLVLSSPSARSLASRSPRLRGWPSAGRGARLTLAGLVWWRYRNEDLSGVPRLARGNLPRLIAIPALALPFIIRAAVIEGVATATEVSDRRHIAATPSSLGSSSTGSSTGGAFPMLERHGGARARSCSSSAQRPVWPPGAHPVRLPRAALLSARRHARQASLMFLAGVDPRLHRPRLGSRGSRRSLLFGPLLFPIARDVGVHEVHHAMVVTLAMGMGSSRRPSASATTPPARSAAFTPTKGSGSRIIGYNALIGL